MYGLYFIDGSGLYEVIDDGQTRHSTLKRRGTGYSQHRHDEMGVVRDVKMVVKREARKRG